MKKSGYKGGNFHSNIEMDLGQKGECSLPAASEFYKQANKNAPNPETDTPASARCPSLPRRGDPSVQGHWDQQAGIQQHINSCAESTAPT